MSKKYPAKIIFKLYPFGLVSKFKPNVHYSLTDFSELIKEMKEHPQTRYYVGSAKKHITYNNDTILVNGKEFKPDEQNSTSYIDNFSLNKSRSVTFDEFSFGYVDLKNPSKHLTDEQVVEFISENTDKKYFLHDRNVRLTIDRKSQLIKTNRPIRKISLWTILVFLCVAVPLTTSFGMMFGTMYMLTTQEKGRRPTMFRDGFAMNLWYHNRGKLFTSRNFWGSHWKGKSVEFSGKKYDFSDGATTNSGFSTDSYQTALDLLSSDDVYTMMMGTFLYSEMTLPLSVDGKYYFPAQQYKSSDGSEDGTHNRHMVPIYNLYSRNIKVHVRKTDNTWGGEWDDDKKGWGGHIDFSLSYSFTYSNNDIAATYEILYAGNVKLQNSFKPNMASWPNKRVYNWGITTNNGDNQDDGHVDLSFKTNVLKGEPADLQATTSWNESSTSYTWDHHTDQNFDPTGSDHEGQPTSAFLPSIINTDPNYQNNIIYTPNVFINWVIDGSIDENWR